MEARPYFLALAIITVLVSVSYFKSPDSSVSLVLALVSLGLVTYFGSGLYVYGITSTQILLTFAVIAILAFFNSYAMIPLVILTMTLYLYENGNLTYSKVMLSSAISAFTFPIAYSVSIYDMPVAPLFLLQASGLAIVKEIIYPGKRALGIIAYSIPFVILLAIAFGRWLEMLVIILIGVWVYKRVGKNVINYESILKLLVVFSVVTFVSYALPLYVFEINKQVYYYLSIITGGY